MFTFVGLYAGWTFSNCDLVTGGASAPHPSSSVLLESWPGRDRELASGLKAALPPDRVGLKAGFEVMGGGPVDVFTGAALPAEYFAPEASETFCTIPSGVRSRSDRAVIWM